MVKQYKGTTTPLANRQDWRTPKFVFDYYNKKYGFICDVSADDDNHLCEKYFTKETDGLKNDWFRFNFCNPEYSNISIWVDKAIEQAGKGNTTVMLIPSDTGVSYFARLYDNCEHIDFIVGRLAFISSLTFKPISGNNKPSMICVFSPKGLVTDTTTAYILRDSMK